MRRTALLLVSVAVASALAAPLPFPKKARGDAELKAWQGVWVGSRVLPRGGRGVETDLVVKGDEMNIVYRGEVTSTWRFTLDPSRSPKAMDMHRVFSTSGVGNLTFLAVYRLEGDTLMFTYGTERPAEVVQKELGAYVFKRKK
jgi:uncharacterized protein (TIGR03067 family)